MFVYPVIESFVIDYGNAFWVPEIFSGGPMRSVLSVCLCVRPSVRPDDNGKTNERIFMKFGI